jgi:hypothetical protein
MSVQPARRNTRTMSGQFHYRDPAKRRPVTIPARVSPEVRLIFQEMARLHVTYDELAEASGATRMAFKAWRRATNRPSLENLEAALNALGWLFLAVPARIEYLPPAVAGKVAEIAALAHVELGEAWAAIVASAAHQLIASAEGPRVIEEVRAVRAQARVALHASRRRKRAANDNIPRAEESAA